MKNKKKTKAVNFSFHKDKNLFFDSFDSKRSYQKYQCLNCEIWMRGDKFIPIGQFDLSNIQIFVFRFCVACWQSYKDVSPELRQDFINNVRRKIKTASEVKIDV